MRILFVTGSLPYPPHQGGALRTYGLLQGLKQAGHELMLLSFTDAGSNFADTPLESFCTRIETQPSPSRSKSARLKDLLFSRQPDIAQRLYDARFEKRLVEFIRTEQPDIIQFEGIEVACYLNTIKRLEHSGKLVYDAFNAEARMQEVIFEIDRRDPRRWVAALYSLAQSRRIAKFEGAVCREVDLVIAVSAEDAALLSLYRPKHPIPVVANGIFTSEYQNSSEELNLGDKALVFTGKMDYRPNVDAVQWFAGQILPSIRQVFTDIKFYIVGQKPHETVEHLRDNPSVVVTGWVESVLPYLTSAAVYVAPLRMGSGTRLKILEAMAAGCAVVATTVAASGMQRESHMGMLIVDKAEQMAETIVQLLNTPEYRAQLGEEARLYVKTHYDWSVLIPHLLNAYKAIERG